MNYITFTQYNRRCSFLRIKGAEKLMWHISANSKQKFRNNSALDICIITSANPEHGVKTIITLGPS